VFLIYKDGTRLKTIIGIDGPGITIWTYNPRFYSMYRHRRPGNRGSPQRSQGKLRGRQVSYPSQ